MGSGKSRGGGGPAAAALVVVGFVCGLCVVVLGALAGLSGAGGLAGIGGGSGAGSVVGVCGEARTVGATEYGGPGDPSSGTVGAGGLSLPAHPDSFAELGGTSFQTATALGGLPYGTALQISSGSRTVVAYKEDIGLGGGPVAGYPRVIDLWWQLARRLRIPYEDGRWSGTVRIA